jgi:phage terminase large subunit-like protein
VNAAEDDGRTKYKIVKGEDRRKIDGAIADILAYEAAMTMPEEQHTESLAAWG